MISSFEKVLHHRVLGESVAVSAALVCELFWLRILNPQLYKRNLNIIKITKIYILPLFPSENFLVIKSAITYSGLNDCFDGESIFATNTYHKIWIQAVHFPYFFKHWWIPFLKLKYVLCIFPTQSTTQLYITYDEMVWILNFSSNNSDLLVP